MCLNITCNICGRFVIFFKNIFPPWTPVKTNSFERISRKNIFHQSRLKGLCHEIFWCWSFASNCFSYSPLWENLDFFQIFLKIYSNIILFPWPKDTPSWLKGVDSGRFFNPLPHGGILYPIPRHAGNDRPRAKTIVEGNPWPPPWYRERSCVCKRGGAPYT